MRSRSPRASRLHVAAAVCALASACGRIGFDPDDGRQGPGGGDGAPGGDGPLVTCAEDLSNLGTDDFSVAFTLQTTETGKRALVFQRAICAGSPGHWEAYIGDGARAGTAVFEMWDGGSGYLVPHTRNVIDGQPHMLEFRRISNTLTAYVDGVAGGSTAGGTGLNMAYPAIQIASGHPCAATMPLQGTITNVCVRRL